jgi:hypothetical protein
LGVAWLYGREVVRRLACVEAAICVIVVMVKVSREIKKEILKKYLQIIITF